MWIYEKKLEYPVKIKQTNPALSQCILTQFGGPNCISVCQSKVVVKFKLIGRFIKYYFFNY